MRYRQAVSVHRHIVTDRRASENRVETLIRACAKAAASHEATAQMKPAGTVLISAHPPEPGTEAAVPTCSSMGNGAITFSYGSLGRSGPALSPHPASATCYRSTAH